MPRIFPSRTDYEMIIHHLDKFAVQPSLKMAKVQMQANQLFPQAYSGGRAVVFPVLENGSKYALKCWIQSLGDLAIRYQQINTFVQQSKPSFMLDSYYLNDELLVNGIRYPVLKMQWVNALTLKEWVCHNISNASALSVMADSFLELCCEMHALSFSHGDLQHENILVGDNDYLVLVDYDSVYIPGLEGLRDEIKGLPGFQHKSRTKLEFCQPYVDFVSEYVIYLSLLGLAKKPHLWDGAKDHNRLLFSEDDISSPDSSIVVDELRSIPELTKVLDAFMSNCKKDSLEKIISLDEVVGNKVKRVVFASPQPKISEDRNATPAKHLAESSLVGFVTWSPSSPRNSTTEWSFGRQVSFTEALTNNATKSSPPPNSGDASSPVSIAKNLRDAMSRTSDAHTGLRADNEDTDTSTSPIFIKTPGCFVNDVLEGHWDRRQLEEISFDQDSLRYVWKNNGYPISKSVALSTLSSWYSEKGTIYLLSGPESCELMFSCSEELGKAREICNQLEKAGIGRRTYLPTLTSDSVREPGLGITQSQEREQVSEIGEQSKNPVSTSSSSGDCFVATVVYRSADHPDVVLLRLFRDDVLAHTRLGRVFIRFYYLTGPIVADFLKLTSLAPSMRPIFSLIVNCIRNSRTSRLL